jgi:hypothetical protein
MRFYVLWRASGNTEQMYAYSKFGVRRASCGGVIGWGSRAISGGVSIVFMGILVSV